MMSIQVQKKKFFATSADNRPMSEISEISKSLDSDENSSIGDIEKYGAHSDFKVVQSATEAQNIAKNPRKSVQVSEGRQNNIGKYRNSNVISFGQGHFSVYQKTCTEKGNVSILEEKENDEAEVKSIEMINRTDFSPANPEKELLKPLREKEGDASNKNGEDQSFEHVSTKSKGIQRTLHNVISNFYLAKKFISILRNATIFRRPKWLNPMHFKMINDRSFYKEGWLDNFRENTEMEDIDSSVGSGQNIFKMFSKMKSSMKKKIAKSTFFNKLFAMVVRMNVVFHPTRAFRIMWDTVHMMIIICYLYILPVNLSFGMNMLVFFELMVPQVCDFFKYFTMIFFFLDIVMNFNTAYYKKGELIYDRRRIVEHYVKHYLFYDLISLLYIFLKIFLGNAQSNAYFPWDNIMAFLFLLRMRNLNTITTKIEEFMLLDETFFNLITLIKLIFGVLLLSHFFACLWHYISFINLDDTSTWLNVYHLAQEVWWKKYISSYYFVVVVMNTVGFGDIVPQNSAERLYSIFFIYFACGMFAYTINSIGIIVQDINKSKKLFKRNLHLINAYMKQKKIKFDLRVRIRKYFEYIWKEESTHNEDETQEIINKLSKSLKDELLFQGNGTILNKLPLFYKNFSQDTLKKLVYEMKEFSFTPGEIIYSVNDSYDPSIFIVRKGEVELYVETPRFLEPITVTRIIKQDEVFGEMSFFAGKERETFARSATFTSVYLIRQEDFVNVVQSNAEDYQTFCQIKDNVRLYEEYKRLFMSCFSCNARDHDSLVCPLLHLTLSKQRILQRFNFSQPQPRLSYRRTRKRAGGALVNCKRYEASANKLMHIMIEDDEEEFSEEEAMSSQEITTETEQQQPQGPSMKNMIKMISDLTEDDTVTMLKEPSQRKFSPKFTDNELVAPTTGSFKSNFGRSHSKKSLKGNKDIFAFDLSSNEITSSIYRTEMKKESSNSNSNPSRSPYRKHLTMASPGYHRQGSKESLSKYSINSKKSNKSKSSFKPQDISRVISKRDIAFKSPNMKSGLNIAESQMSIGKFNLKNRTEDSFMKDVSMLLKKERQKKILFTESSIPSKESKQKTTSSMIDKGTTEQTEENFYERMMKTATDGDNIVIFDVLKSFEFYFPHNNIENIVKTIQENYEKRIKKKRLNKLTTKKNNELANLIRYNTKMQKGQLINKRGESDKNINIDKAKLIKLLKEQEKKLARKKGYMVRMMEFLRLKKKETMLPPQRRKSFRKIMKT